MTKRYELDISARAMALAAAGALALCVATPALGQMSDEAIVRSMQECARIDDPSARLQCYDGNFRSSSVIDQRPSVANVPATPPVQAPPIASQTPVIGSSDEPQGFGAESVKSEDRFKSPAETGKGVDEIRTRILAVSRREPGKYMVTVEDGAVWVFTDAVARTFRPPRQNALVEIKRASLGSFLMVVDGQAAVRVRRLK